MRMSVLGYVETRCVVSCRDASRGFWSRRVAAVCVLLRVVRVLLRFAGWCCVLLRMGRLFNGGAANNNPEKGRENSEMMVIQYA